MLCFCGNSPTSVLNPTSPTKWGSQPLLQSAACVQGKPSGWHSGFWRPFSQHKLCRKLSSPAGGCIPKGAWLHFRAAVSFSEWGNTRDHALPHKIVSFSNQDTFFPVDPGAQGKSGCTTLAELQAIQMKTLISTYQHCAQQKGHSQYFQCFPVISHKIHVWNIYNNIDP